MWAVTAPTINNRNFADMQIEVLKSKIHRVTITQANLDYVGSITVDEDLLDAANMIAGEKVQIVNVNNGERLETYIIKGTARLRGGQGLQTLGGLSRYGDQQTGAVIRSGAVRRAFHRRTDRDGRNEIRMAGPETATVETRNKSAPERERFFSLIFLRQPFVPAMVVVFRGKGG